MWEADASGCTRAHAGRRPATWALSNASILPGRKLSAREPIYVTDIQVTDVQRRKFSEDDFRIWYDSPGSMVTDYTHPEAVDGEAVAFFVPGAIGEVYGNGLGRSLKVWLVVLNAGIICMIVYTVWWRRRRSA